MSTVSRSSGWAFPPRGTPGWTLQPSLQSASRRSSCNIGSACGVMHAKPADVSSRAAFALQLGLTSGVLCTAAAQHRQTVPRRMQPRTVRRISGAADDAPVLEQRARQLRVEAAEAEADVGAARARRKAAESARWFEIFDADGSGGIGVEDMRQGVAQLCGGGACSAAQATELIELFDEDADGALGPHEFDHEALQRAVAGRQRAARESVERERRAGEEAAEAWRGAAVQALACLPYALPVLVHLEAPATGDALNVRASSFAHDYALLAEAYLALREVGSSLFHFWWVQPLLLYAIVLLAGAEQLLPRWVRFNMLQAAVLDVACFLPGQLAVATVALGVGDVYFDQKPVIFYLLLLCVAYCVFCNLVGRLPDGIPGVSAVAKNGLSWLEGVQRW
mmetsp:Transcript_89663/g.262132  ORF Transcript_89663/g.262132 Transcript_89663/m.262132 type:complete len:394 (-) Transcript_89663:64-1245(-)